MAQQEDKPFNIGSLREITDLYEEGEISYGRMVELLNEIAIKWHNQQQLNGQKMSCIWILLGKKQHID